METCPDYVWSTRSGDKTTTTTTEAAASHAIIMSDIAITQVNKHNDTQIDRQQHSMSWGNP